MRNVHKQTAIAKHAIHEENKEHQTVQRAQDKMMCAVGLQRAHCLVLLNEGYYKSLYLMPAPSLRV